MSGIWWLCYGVTLLPLLGMTADGTVKTVMHKSPSCIHPSWPVLAEGCYLCHGRLSLPHNRVLNVENTNSSGVGTCDPSRSMVGWRYMDPTPSAGLVVQATDSWCLCQGQHGTTDPCPYCSAMYVAIDRALQQLRRVVGRQLTQPSLRSNLAPNAGIPTPLKW